jgi:hypothetical protein
MCWGMQINLMDNTTWGYNALMLAAQYDHQDVARMLIHAGADTSLLTSTDGVDENNWSNIMVAAWQGDDEVRPSLSFAPPNSRSAAQPHGAFSYGKCEHHPLHARMGPTPPGRNTVSTVCMRTLQSSESGSFCRLRRLRRGHGSFPRT